MGISFGELGPKREVVLNGSKGVPKLGKTPRAHLGPIWPNKIDFGNPQGYSYECVGGYIWGLFIKNIEF